MVLQFVFGEVERLLMPKISVVLPVYNGDTYLKTSIESVLDQTYRDFELIIVDDCSTDNTASIAKKYEESYANIFYIKNEVNLKLPEALNKGFSQALGEYWTWTSCDNLYLPNAFQQLVAAHEAAKNIGLVYADMKNINNHGDIIGVLEAGDPEDLIFRNVVGACFLYKASIAQQIGGYNKNAFLCEDYEYWLRLSRIASLKPIKECLYLYRFHSDSLSSKHEKRIIEKGIQFQKQYYPFFIKSRKKAALFYAALRGRDIYNPFRQFYLFKVFYYSPLTFLKEIKGLIIRRFKKNEKD